jgi:hypothetical protein
MEGPKLGLWRQFKFSRLGVSEVQELEVEMPEPEVGTPEPEVGASGNLTKTELMEMISTEGVN